MKPNVIVIHPDDNVAVALEDLHAGATVCLPDGRTFDALTAVPYSHKIALVDIGAGAAIVKYGEPIGTATEDCRRGYWIHTHNLDIEGKERP